MSGVQVHEGDGVDRADVLRPLYERPGEQLFKEVDCLVCNGTGRLDNTFFVKVDWEADNVQDQWETIDHSKFCSHCHGSGKRSKPAKPCRSCMGHGMVRRIAWEDQEVAQERCEACGGTGSPELDDRPS
jgi:RecJ-like exonuclease